MRDQMNSRRRGEPAPAGQNVNCDDPRAQPPLYVCGRRLLTSWLTVNSWTRTQSSRQS